MAERLTLPQQRALETRERIVAAARTTFAERGYEAATMDDIAAAAGASKGALYHHFATKEDLFRAMLDDHRSELDAFAQAVEAASSFRDLLDRLVGQWLDHYRSEPQFVSLSLEVRVQARRQPWFRAALGRHHDQLRGFLRGLVHAAREAGLVPADLDPQAHAVLLFGLLDGVCLQAGVTPAGVDLDDQREPLRQGVERLLRIDERRAGDAAEMPRLRAALQSLLAQRPGQSTGTQTST